jgi:hypothetical protein
VLDLRTGRPRKNGVKEGGDDHDENSLHLFRVDHDENSLYLFRVDTWTSDGEIVALICVIFATLKNSFTAATVRDKFSILML